MKKTISLLFAMSVIMAACQKQEFPDTAERSPLTFTATVSMEASETKALTGKGVKTFSAGDRIAVVYRNTAGKTVRTESASLAVSDITGNGKTASFTVTLADPDKTKQVTFIYPAVMAKADGSVNYESLANQDGTIDYIARYLDYCEFTGEWNGPKLPDGIMTNKLAICAFTLKDEAGAVDLTATVTEMTIFDGTHSYMIKRKPVPGPVYVALRPTSGADITYDVTGKRLYKKSVKAETLEAGHFYLQGLKMAEVSMNIVDLSKLSGHYEAKNRDVLTGTLGGKYKITVADGAFVILRDVTINGGKKDDESAVWAGITPLGDAILFLEGTNIVQSFGPLHPGIYAAEGHTLTIRGDGKLTVKSVGGGCGIGGGCNLLFAIWGKDIINCGDIVIDGGTIDAFGICSGIGAPNSGRCGNITINGGIVQATGKVGAGIGTGMPGISAMSSCGNITINGGTITAQGSAGFAGIGGGTGNTLCGNITISPDVERVQATKGNNAPNAIGPGKDGKCGIVTIGGTIYWDGRAYQNNGGRYLGSSPLVYPAP